MDTHGMASRGSLEDLVDVAYALVTGVDAKGVVTGWSAGACRLLGYPPAEVIGRAVVDLLAMDVPETAWQTAVARQGWNGTVGVRHQDGHRVELELRAYPLLDAAANTQWLLVASTLLRSPHPRSSHHERGRGPARPRELPPSTTCSARQGDPSTPEDPMESVDDQTIVDWGFRQSQLFMVVYDSEARFWRLSAGAIPMIGYDETAVRGQRLMDALPDHSYAAFQEQLRHVAQTGKSVIYENHVRAPGEPREHAWATSMSPITDPTGRVLGVFAAAFDVSEQHWARQRLALLDEASTRIGSTLDVTRTAQELADMAVPRLADWVSVDLLESVYHGDEPVPGPVVGPVALRRSAHQSVVEGSPYAVVKLGQVDTYPEFSPPACALATGRPSLYQILESDIAQWIADDPTRNVIASYLGFHSVMFVPLRARGTTLGIAVFARHRRPEPFGQEDLLLAEELGARAAVSIDNARRYTRERNTALTLQRSLLPQRLPDQTAVQVASRYRPTGSQLGVGGDWYDVIPLSGARVALVVGDVVGHGIHAAATMGRLRTAVRTLADADPAPEELLTRLDDVVSRLSMEDNAFSGSDPGTDIGATCLYAVYDPVSRYCSLASAGHPLPAVVAPDGTVDFLTMPVGPPLGVGALPFEAMEVELPEGSLLVLYTDGLVESRSRDIDVGLDALRHALTIPARSLEVLCDTVLDTLLPEHPEDDVALLVARTRTLDPGQIAAWDLPADPAVVAHIRAQASHQLAAWGLEHAIFTTELVVSELVTNAIRHACGPIQVRLILDSTLICEVSDASSAAPHLRRAHSLDEGGRGLLLVAQLTKRWGTRHTSTGKTIWAEQPLPTF